MKKSKVRKLAFSFVLIFLCLFGVINPFSNDLYGDGRLIPVMGYGEHETIDPMNVHPESGRWDTSNVGFTATIDQGRLKCTDTGDESLDYYKVTRKIRDIYGTIEVQFYLETTSTVTYDLTNRFYIGLYESHYTDGILFDVQALTTTTSQTKIVYYSSGGTIRSREMSTDVKPDTWYMFRLTYDLSKSNLRYQLFFDNESEIWDHTWHDINSANFPSLFAADNLELEIYTSSASDSKVITSYVDNVLAPFDLRNWEHTDIGVGTWLSQASWEFARAEDNIDDTTGWQLTVQNLDRTSGVLVAAPDDRTAFAVGDHVTLFYRVYCIDGDDGDSHEAFEIELIYYKSGASSWITYMVIDVDGVQAHISSNQIPTGDISAVQFIVGAKEDRSLLVYEVLFKWDTTDETQSELFTGDIAVSDIATDPSQEFILEVQYEMDFDGDTEVTGFVDDWEIISNWLWAALAVIGIGFGILTILTMTVGAQGGGGLFQPLFDVWDGIIKGFQDIFGPFILAFLEWAGNVISDAFTFLWDAFENFVGFITDSVFWLWDELNLPDFLAIVEILLDNFFDLVNGVPQLITDLMEWVELLSLILIAFWWFYVVFLQFASAGFNPLEGTANMFDAMFGSAIHLIIVDVPQFLIMIPLTFFMVLSPAGSVYFIW